MARRPWVVTDELWQLVEPLVPARERRFRSPGRRRLPDRECLSGILYVLHTRTPWHIHLLAPPTDLVTLLKHFLI